MKKSDIVRFTSIGGLLTAVAVLFQSAPVFLPAIGLALSPFSTLPVAMAAAFHLSLGIAVLISSAGILIFVSLQESMIFLFATGLLGIILGTMQYSKRVLVPILEAAIALTIGIFILTYVAVIPSFADFATSFPVPVVAVLLFAFSLVYASIWHLCIRNFFKKLIQISENL